MNESPAQILADNLDAALGLSNKIAAGVQGAVNKQSVDVSVSGATTTIDLSKGDHFVLTMNASTTLAFSSIPTTGKVRVTFDVVQAGAGSFTLTGPTGTKTPGGSGLTLSTAAGSRDRVEMDNFDDGNWSARVVGLAYA